MNRTRVPSLRGERSTTDLNQRQIDKWTGDPSLRIGQARGKGTDHPSNFWTFNDDKQRIPKHAYATRKLHMRNVKLQTGNNQSLAINILRPNQRGVVTRLSPFVLLCDLRVFIFPSACAARDYSRAVLSPWFGLVPGAIRPCKTPGGTHRAI